MKVIETKKELIRFSYFACVCIVTLHLHQWFAGNDTSEISPSYSHVQCLICLLAPWYVSNYTLHNDLQIPVITEEIKRYSRLYYNRLIGHENSNVTQREEEE
jgi:hypothetical protein